MRPPWARPRLAVTCSRRAAAAPASPSRSAVRRSKDGPGITGGAAPGTFRPAYVPRRACRAWSRAFRSPPLLERRLGGALRAVPDVRDLDRLTGPPAPEGEDEIVERPD